MQRDPESVTKRLASQRLNLSVLDSGLSIPDHFSVSEAPFEKILEYLLNLHALSGE